MSCFLEKMMNWQKERTRKKDVRAIEYFDAFSIPEYGYPSFDSSTFRTCEEEAKKLVQTMNLDVHSGKALDGLIRLQSLELFYRQILLHRLQNSRAAKGSRSEKELLLRNQLTFVQTCSNNLALIDSELKELGYYGDEEGGEE